MCFEVYRCTECGKVDASLGSLHAHIERHRGFYGLQWPWKLGDYDELMKYTEVVEVTDWRTFPGDVVNPTNGGEIDREAFE